MKIKSIVAVIVAVVFGLLLLYSISQAAPISMSEVITSKGKIEKASELKFEKDAKMVDTERVEVTDPISGKKTVEDKVTNDIGITIHHHWTSSTTANTIMRAGNMYYTGKSIFKDKDVIFVVDTAEEVKPEKERK